MAHSVLQREQAATVLLRRSHLYVPILYRGVTLNKSIVQSSTIYVGTYLLGSTSPFLHQDDKVGWKWQHDTCSSLS